MAERPKHCRDCGKPATLKRTISRRGRCVDCATKRVAQALRRNDGAKVMTDPVWRKRWEDGVRQAKERERQSW